jgi:hypothetical protein
MTSRWPGSDGSTMSCIGAEEEEEEEVEVVMALEVVYAPTRVKVNAAL